MGPWYNFVVRTLVASVFSVVASAGTAPAQLIYRNASARTVLSTMSPPILGVVDDMVAAEGDTVAQTVRASDPDADYLDFYGVYFFPFMRIDPISPGPSDASARIVLTPRVGDHGRATVGLGVTDGVSNAETPFNITILEKHPGATWLALRVEPRPWDIVWDSVRFDQLDGTFSASGTAETGVTVTFDPPEPLTKGSSVALSCMPAQRPACVSDRVNWWQLRFEPPLGGTLEPGLYEGATGSRDAQHAALQVRPFCGSVQSCTVADSWFDVREAVFDLAGALVSFWATFERRCSDSPTVVSGEIRYRASPPVFVDAPSRVEAHAGALLEVDMPVGRAAPEPRSVVSPDLPPGASLTMVTPDHARLTWTPGLHQAGTYDLGLIAQASLATPDTVRMTICVDVPGALTATMDVNRTTVITTNQGDAAYDAARDAPGVRHPTGSSIPVANAIGLALAAVVDGEVRLSLRDGYPAYAPGPLVNGMPAPFVPEFKNYTIRRSEPSGYDWEHWPVDQGAPVDGTGRPLILGDATIWSLYNDARVSVPPEPPRATPPLSVEVRQTTWASASYAPLSDVVFQRFQIRNASADTLDEAYAGLLVDATTFEFFGHVGEPSRGLAGCDTALGLGYAYSAENCGRPNAVGVAILRGPVTSTGIAGADTLGLTAFQDRRYHSTDPVGGTYNQLRGLLPNGEARHEFDDPARPTTPYAYTGDPIAGTGWLYPPSCYTDAEFYASTGPFRLLPGEEQQIVVAIVAATGSDRLDAVRRIREATAAARGVAIPVANRAPVAAAGGPYQGRAGAPIEFDASGSFDPDGDPLSFTWEFGDGAMDGGARASHAYAQDGIYTVVLVASDHAISDSDTTIAEVGTLSVETGTDAHVLPGDAVIRLASGRPYAWIAVEPGGQFKPSDVILSTVTLARADGSLVPIGPVQDKARLDVDEDSDGIPEIAVAFSKAELRSLLENLPPGRSEVPVVIAGDLQDGGRFTAPLNLVVEAGRPGLHANVAPNPFNPGATLTIHTSRAGRMRVSLFNASGQLVRTLLNAAAQPAGYHDIAVDRRSGEDATLASGLYFYRVEAAEGSITGRFVILK
jgi:PKD repeat protein